MTVASSWIDMLAGLSRLGTRRMPPFFCAKPGAAMAMPSSRAAPASAALFNRSRISDVPRLIVLYAICSLCQFGRRKLPYRPKKLGIEHLCRDDLTAPDQPDLIRPVIGDRAVDRAEMIPDENIVLAPDMRIAELRLKLVREQIVEHLVAVALGKLVDAHREAGIAVQHLAAGDRMREKDRMHDRRAAVALFVGHRRSLAAAAAPHVLPEFFDVVGRI